MMPELTVEDIVAAIHRARAHPDSAEAVALRLAAEEIIRQAREQGEDVPLTKQEHVEVSQAVSGGADWAAVGNNHVEYDDLQKRRAEARQAPRPAPDPELREAFDRVEEEQEAWRRDDEVAEHANAQEAAR